MTPRNGAPVRLLLVAPPFSGHLNPLIAIAVRLRERGFDPRFVTGASQVGLLRQLGFVADAVPGVAPDAFERIADTTRPVRSNPLRLMRQLSANLALMPPVRQALRHVVARDRPRLVLADYTAPVAGLVAREAGLGWVTLMPTPFVLPTRHGTPAYCGGWGPPRHAGHRLRDAAGRGATRLALHGVQLRFGRQLRALGTSVWRPDGSQAAFSPQAILGLGMREVEFDRDWPDCFQLIGPITETPEPLAAPPPLPEGPLVLVTVGTHLRWVKAELPRALRRLAVAFADHTFLVSLGRSPGSGQPRPSPAGVAGNVVVVDHLPYDAVLPRVAAVIHHGGAGITYSAIRAGKPSVVWPHDYDQFDFAARVVAAGAGVRLRRLDSGAAVVALRRALRLEPRVLRGLAAAAAGYDPYRAVEATLRRLLAPG